ncbi:DNA-binding protein [Caballeronia jiangsuensis]|nr:DNA-binding protein [Caballeronia jiangsuensis]
MHARTRHRAGRSAARLCATANGRAPGLSQRSCDLPRRPDVHAGGLRVRLRLQFVQHQHGRRRLLDRVSTSRAWRRSVDCRGDRADLERPHRNLRYPRHKSGRRGGRDVSRQVGADQRHRDPRVTELVK